MNGTWFAPAVGHTKVPLGLDGAGTLEWNGAGVTVTGQLQSKNAASVFGCLGFFLMFAIGIGLSAAVFKDARIGAAIGLSGLPIGIWVGRKLFPAKQVTLTFPWDQLDAFEVDTRVRPTGALLTFRVKGSFFKPGTPSGAVYFEPAQGTIEDALAQLEKSRVR